MINAAPDAYRDLGYQQALFRRVLELHPLRYHVRERRQEIDCHDCGSVHLLPLAEEEPRPQLMSLCPYSTPLSRASDERDWWAGVRADPAIPTMLRVRYLTVEAHTVGRWSAGQYMNAQWHGELHRLWTECTCRIWLPAWPWTQARRELGESGEYGSLLYNVKPAQPVRLPDDVHPARWGEM